MAIRFEPLTTVLHGIADALSPLSARLADTATVQDLLAEQGLLLDVVPSAITDLGVALDALTPALDRFATALDGNDPLAILSSADDLGRAIADITTTLDGLPAALEAELVTIGEQLAAVDVATIGTRIFDAQLVDHLSVNLPALVHGLGVLGIVERPPDLTQSALSDPTNWLAHPGPDVETLTTTSALTTPRIHWDRFTTLVDDPRALFADVYGWGTDSFKGERLVTRVLDFVRALGFAARVEIDPDAARPALTALAVEGATIAAPLFQESGGPVALEAGLTAGIVPGTSAGDAGFALGIFAEGDLSLSFPITGDVTASLSSSAGLETGLAFVMRPPFQVEAITDPAGAGASAAADAQLTFRWEPEGGFTPLALSGVATLTIEAIEAGLGLATGAGGVVAPEVSMRLDGGRFEIGSGESDSFLTSVLGGGCQADFALGFTWSPETGVRFDGAAGLSTQINVGAAIGPIHLDWITIELLLDDTGAVLEVRATGGVELGPFVASVDGIGVGLALSTADAQDGNLGPFQLNRPAFVPPHGLGLAIQTDVVTGGGYLYLDPDKGEYAGVGELALLGVGITIVGVLATKLPDGSDGWSMFLSLSITFTGLQLGFGFTLNGLGGLVGVNRGLDEDALASGVRTGALDSILFPQDAIANAPQILSDIGSVFPAAPGQFVFGPIARIGWGTPTLISLELGIILQLPEPLTVTLLGSLESLLPTPDAAVIELRLDVAGTLNITEGTLKIDASLRDSRVLTLELSGDMAVRASFFDDPTFLVSFGGFHPDFPPPADFPTLARLSIALDTGDNLRIQLGGYFALTSNTVQFGASFYFWAEAIGFTAEGGTTFDALIYFSPFGFIVGLRLWASISAGSFDLLGVDLRADLTGPNPWHVAGSATFKILGVKKSLDLQATIGQPKDDEPKAIIFVEDLLIAELGREDAWSALAPTVDGDGVVLVESDPDAREVHPAGRIEVRQRVVPLATRIDHYGEANLGGADQFELAAPRIGASTLDEAAIEEVEDWFAAAQYFDLGEDERLAAPSFEPMPAGLRLGDEAARAGKNAELTCDHEIAYRDPNGRAAGRENTGALYNATRISCDRALSMSGALAARTAARLPRSTKSTGVFGVNASTYVAIQTRTGEVATALTPKKGTSYYAARDAVRGADSPNRAVVPTYELELLG